RDLVDYRNIGFKLFQNRILDDFGVDHLLQLELVHRQYADHLHESRGQDLLLRNLKIKSVLKKDHLVPVSISYSNLSDADFRASTNSSVLPGCNFRHLATYCKFPATHTREKLSPR